MNPPDLIALAKQIAESHKFFAHIICGICEQESSWNPWSIRYEPAFEVRYIEPMVHAGKLTDMTEIKARSISWGLMQTMGQSVRELGYEDKMAKLCDPATGIEWGCRLFERKLGFSGGNYTQALTIWNGGADLTYAPSVLAKSVKYQ